MTKAELNTNAHRARRPRFLVVATSCQTCSVLPSQIVCLAAPAAQTRPVLNVALSSPYWFVHRMFLGLFRGGGGGSMVGTYRLIVPAKTIPASSLCSVMRIKSIMPTKSHQRRDHAGCFKTSLCSNSYQPQSSHGTPSPELERFRIPDQWHQPSRTLESPLHTSAVMHFHFIQASGAMKEALVDVSKCDFSNLDLSGKILSATILDGASFRNTKLQGIEMQKAQAQGMFGGCFLTLVAQERPCRSTMTRVTVFSPCLWCIPSSPPTPVRSIPPASQSHFFSQMSTLEMPISGIPISTPASLMAVT